MTTSTKPALQAGLTFEWRYTVPAKATVPRLYDDISGCEVMPEVLATGYMVGIMECACLQAIQPYLDWPREQSLGTHVSFSHLAATPPGMTVTVKGRLEKIEGRKLTFSVEAWDAHDKISEGTHERHLILADKFNDKLTNKLAPTAK